jgi:hypothetical protein
MQSMNIKTTVQATDHEIKRLMNVASDSFRETIEGKGLSVEEQKDKFRRIVEELLNNAFQHGRNYERAGL